MESVFFSPESERYMIEHMNEDHADATLMYAKVYGKRSRGKLIENQWVNFLGFAHRFC